MNRIRMSNALEPQLDLSNEIIDLTGDSPVVNRIQLRARRAHNSQLRADSPIPILYDPLVSSIDQDNSYIDLIDEVAAGLRVRRFANEEFKDVNSGKSNEEYSTTVPCINDSYSERQVVLSCPICFESLAAERRPMATNCGHIFCAECLKQTLQRSRNKTCPKCNAPVKIKSCIRLYF